LKAHVLESFGQRLKLREDVPTPKPKEGEALIRVKACGIGLTLSWVRLGRMGATLPRIIGHEISGVVEETGPSVKTLSRGDSVAVYFYLTCGRCRYCLTDRETICENFGGNVGTRIDGGLAEFVSLPESNLFKFSSKKIDYESASIISDAIATPLHIARKRAKISPLDKVMVIGAGGGVGVHMVQMAAFFGAEVYAVDVDEKKLDLAKRFGASYAINARKEDVPLEISKLTRAGESESMSAGVDSVIDFVSSRESIEKGFASLRAGGKLVLLGHFHPEDPFHLDDPQTIIRKELSILGSRYATKQEFREAIELVERGLIKPVVTHVYDFEDADMALLDVEEGKVAGRAVVRV
jgi:propanol-preferring alcohol dehydrogenase